MPFTVSHTSNQFLRRMSQYYLTHHITTNVKQLFNWRNVMHTDPPGTIKYKTKTNLLYKCNVTWRLVRVIILEKKGCKRDVFWMLECRLNFPVNNKYGTYSVGVSVCLSVKIWTHFLIKYLFQKKSCCTQNMSFVLLYKLLNKSSYFKNKGVIY